jgi:hypothetical protein
MFSSCASRGKLELRAPSRTPKPEALKSTERAVQGLNNISRLINSADFRVDRLQRLVDELETQ